MRSTVGFTVAEFDRVLGDPHDADRAGSFRTAVATDRVSRFPHELCRAAFDWGIADHLIPASAGGRLRAVEEALAISRVVARRDLTAAAALGASFLASLPVWLRGTASQQAAVADLLRSREFLSFAVSEADHGADVLAGEVVARPAGTGWRVDGTKWLINNASRAAGATLLTRTGTGVRGLTAFLLIPTGSARQHWQSLPKIRTHGLRGSMLGGIKLSGYPVGPEDVIGRPGHGLTAVLHPLQITRMLVAGFALGGLETCLRAVLAFARSRRLYGRPIASLDPVRRRLVDSYADLLVGSALARVACRTAHLAPDQFPLGSSTVKYLVPQLAIDGVESLSVLLGARAYLATEHWYGIVEKMRRDLAVTALFDGSTPVTLNAIADQLPALRLARAAGEVPQLPVDLLDRQLPEHGWFPLLEETDLVTDADAVQAGLAAARRRLTDEPGPYQTRLLAWLRWFEAETERLDGEVAAAAASGGWHRSGTAYDLAARYSHLHAAGACAWVWLSRRQRAGDEFTRSGAWLLLCLRRLARRLAGAEPAGGAAEPADVDDTILDEVDHTAYLRLEGAQDPLRMLDDEDPGTEM